MRRLQCLTLFLALGLAPGCLATWSAHDALVEEGEVTGKVAFYVLLPALVVIDIATAPFQYVYVITHAPD